MQFKPEIEIENKKSRQLGIAFTSTILARHNLSMSDFALSLEIDLAAASKLVAGMPVHACGDVREMTSVLELRWHA